MASNPNIYCFMILEMFYYIADIFIVLNILNKYYQYLILIHHIPNYT